jgi:hypothetical protein
MRLEDLITKWEATRIECQKLHAMVDGAGLCELVIADLQTLEASLSSEVLTLRAASERSGYSAEHIGRMIREGTLANMGRKHAPRVLASQLPRRAQPVARSSSAAYDSSSDARSLRSRR